ncbi:MAG: type 4a pilus biogenesis protein PilO [bacterium]|nr:type 4a pilus biogenesis protein PilO [bacterium]
MRFGKDSWIVLGLLVAMVAGAVLIVYRGQGKKIDELKTKILAGEASLKVRAETVKTVPDLVKQVAAMRKRYKNFDRKLPDRQELGGFLKEISGYLGDEKFTEQVIEPGSPTQEELFHTLPIIMRFKGSYLTSVEFFKRIDEMKRLTRMQKLKITKVPVKSKGPGSAGTPELNIELQLNIYFAKS